MERSPRLVPGVATRDQGLSPLLPFPLPLSRGGESKVEPGISLRFLRNLASAPLPYVYCIVSIHIYATDQLSIEGSALLQGSSYDTI